MAENPRTAKDIFLAALDGDPAERAALLDEACAGDAALRAQVDALLQVHDQPDSILDQSRIDFGLTQAGNVADLDVTEDRSPLAENLGSQIAATEIATKRNHTRAEEKPDTQIGPYKILQKLGEGGMGVVYMAEQKEPVNRRVALKIIKPGMDTEQVIARFEAERQALALMDHPNIARVLDAGATTSGRPYFVMELVHGVPFTEYCDQRQLTPEQRLRLFLPICEAVQHAHQKGIIHRDLKPSNVLVARYDERPMPKVIDFGIAKATGQSLTDKTMFTQFGQVVGTLEYMSPEQAEPNQLDVDTRSDIYSLGVMLYELLTGTPPHDRQQMRSGAFNEILRIIREEDPPRPSTRLSTIDALPSVAANRSTEPRKLSTLVRGELDWIVMKALEKDRARRYETANSFAEDIRRYLNDEAVVACPPSAIYRFQKFARRNKALLGTTAMIAVALVAGLVGTSSQWWRAETQKERAEAEAARANTEAQRATVEAHRANSELRISKVTRLAAESRISKHDQPIRSLLLAIEAVAASRAEEQPLLPIAHEALLNATQHVNGLPLTGLAGVVSDMTMTSDWLVSLAANTVQLWDLTARDPASAARILGEEDEPIISMDVSEDGHYLVTAGSMLQRWDLSARNPDASPRVLEGPKANITTLDLSPDGRWLVTQSADHTLRLRDLSATDPTASRVFAQQTDRLHQVVVSPDGRWVATKYGNVGTDGWSERSELWDLDAESASPLLLTERNGVGIAAGKMVISPDGRLLLIQVRKPGQQMYVYIFDLRATDPPTSPRVIREDTSAGLLITPDSRWLFRGGGATYSDVHRWDLSAQDLAASHKSWPIDEHGARPLALSRDGRGLVIGSWEGKTRLWDLDAEDPSSTRLIFGSRDDAVRQAAIHPSGRWIATAGKDYGTVRLWNLAVAERALSPFVLRGQHDDEARSLPAISSDGRWIATTITITDSDDVNESEQLSDPQGSQFSRQRHIQLWDLNAQDPSTFSGVLRGHRRRINSVQISSDDRWLVTGSWDNTVRLWDLTAPDIESSSQVLVSPDTEDPSLGRLALDPTGRWLAVASTNSNILLWDLTDLSAAPRVLTGHEKQVPRMAISRDGRWLVTNPDREAARVWDLSAADPQEASYVLNGYTGLSHSLAIAGNGRWLALPDEGDTYLFDLESQDPTASPRVIRLPDTHFSRKLGWSTPQISSVAISPNARWLFTQRYVSTGQLWDLQLEDPPPLDLPRDAAAWSVAMSPDGRWMVTGTQTGIAQLWDLTAPDPTSTVRSLRGHEATIWKVKVSADSRWLITDASDGTIRRWSLDVEWLLSYAREVAGRELTADERKYYRLDR